MWKLYEEDENVPRWKAIELNVSIYLDQQFEKT